MVGIVGIFAANSVGDDIEVYTDESRAEVAARFHGLRQQAEKDSGEAYYCISDFIAPRSTGTVDYLGMFANSGELLRCPAESGGSRCAAAQCCSSSGAGKARFRSDCASFLMGMQRWV